MPNGVAEFGHCSPRRKKESGLQLEAMGRSRSLFEKLRKSLLVHRRMKERKSEGNDVPPENPVATWLRVRVVVYEGWTLSSLCFSGELRVAQGSYVWGRRYMQDKSLIVLMQGPGLTLFWGQSGM